MPTLQDIASGHRSMVLLGALLVGILSSAFSQGWAGGWLILTMANLILGCAGAYLLSVSRRWLVWVGTVAIITVLLEFFALSRIHEGLLVAASARLGSLALVGLLLFAVLKYSILPDDIRKVDRITAGICGYLLIGNFWANLLQLIALINANAFLDPNGGEMTRPDFLYLSLTSLTSVGFGDVVPVAIPARIVCVLESVVGVLYLAVFISALIASPAAKRQSALGSVGDRERTGREGVGE